MIINEELIHSHFSHTFQGIFLGWGGEDYPTVSRQGVELGLYSFQVELERSIRKKIQNDDRLLKEFAGILLNIFNRVKLVANSKCYDDKIPLLLLMILGFGIIKYKTSILKTLFKMLKKL